MTAYPAAGDYYKAVQAPARVFTVPKLQAAEFVWDSLGPTLARGSSAVVFQASVEGRPQALRCYIRNDASSRDRYSALDAYLAAHDLSPYVSGTTWLDGAIQVNRATWPVLTMDWIDGRTLNEYVDFLVAELQRRRPDHAGRQVACAGRAAAEQRVRPRRPAARQRHGRPGGAASPGRFRRGLDSAASGPVPAHRVRPPELPAPSAARLGPLARHLLRPGHLPVAGRARQGSRALAGALQLQEPAVRQERLLPPVQDRGLEAAGRDGGPAGRRARPAAAGVLRSGLGVQQEPGDDPRPAGRDPGAAADPGRAALVGEKARGPAAGTPARPAPAPASPSAAPAPAGPAAAPRRPSRRHAPRPAPHRPRRPTARICRGFAARPASAVRAARPGGYRTDAAAEPDDGAARRHHLVVRTGLSVRPGPGRGPCPTGPWSRVPVPRGSAPMPAPGTRRVPPVPPAPGAPVPGPSASAPAARSRSRDRSSAPSRSASGSCS